MIEALPTCFVVSISNSRTSLSIDGIQMITAINTIEYVVLTKSNQTNKMHKIGINFAS